MSASRRKKSREIEPDDEHLEVLEELSEDDEFETLEELTEDDELEELGDADELEELETDDAVEIKFADDTLDINVGNMEKAAITDAVDGPLQRAAHEHGAAIRFHSITVTFQGDAMIPTATKDLCGEILKGQKPAKVTVKRGYGDEVVFEGPVPILKVKTSVEGDDTVVDADTKGLDADDIGALFPPELDKLCADAGGKCFSVRFSGEAADTNELRNRLVAAGAVRVAVGDEVLYDKALAELVSIHNVGDETIIEVGAGQSAERTVEILTAALDDNASDLNGKSVQVTFAAGAARPEESACLARAAARHKPTRLTVGSDILWPALLKVASKGNRTALKMDPAGRTDLAAAMQREIQAVPIEGQELSFDWPAGMAIDSALQAVLVGQKPKSLAYTFGGEDKEPVWPAPITFGAEGETTTIDVDSEAGKPAELIRAMQRHFGSHDLNGKKTEVRIQGQGLVSRTMKQTIVELLQAGGAAQGAFTDQGKTEVLFPKLLTVEAQDDASRISVGDCTESDLAAVLADELDEHGLGDGASLRIVSSAHDALLVNAVLERGAQRVVLEGDVHLQVHPPLFADPARDGDAVTVTAHPDADESAVAVQLDHELPVLLEELGDLSAAEVTLAWPSDDANRQTTLDRLLAAGPAKLCLDDGAAKVKQLHPEIVRTYVDILGRRDAGEPPMLLIGVDIDDADGAAAALSKISEEVAGRRVLVVFREDEREVQGPADNAVVQATLATLQEAARSVLLFRPQTRRADKHFEVVHSTVEGLAVGAKMKDPRG